MGTNESSADSAVQARSPGKSYQELLDEETNPVPDSLRENTNPYLGSENLSVDRYLSREFHEKEVEHVWKRTWQAVCRETEVGEPGDTHVYDIVRFSIIVCRTEQGSLKAYRNACLHRGRQLVDENGNYQKFSCPYHAFTWGLDGDFKGAPCKWDFPHIDADTFGLPEVQVDTWGGWVFINMDPDAQPLQEYLGILPQHFQRWNPENAYKMVHVEKIIPCNWKVGWEAFIESYHAVATHPRILDYTDDANSQYDVWPPHISRTITALGVPSFHLDDISDQKVADSILGVSAMVARPDGTEVPEGMSAREFMVLCQLPTGAERPADYPARRMGEDELFSQAPELGEALGTIFDQDLFNMPMIQKGMHNVESRELVLANYHEVRIRHFHQTIDRYIDGEL